MKDFNEILKQNLTLEQEQRAVAFTKHAANSLGWQQSVKQNDYQLTFGQKNEYWIEQMLRYSSPFLLSVITGPFTTLSIALQVTQKPLIKPKILSTQSMGSPVMFRLAKSGMLGDNTTFLAQKLYGYHDGFQKLAKQGVRGMYKGNLTGIMAMSLNTLIRNQLYQYIHDPHFQRTYSQISKTSATILLCTIADWLTLPLIFAQSRLVLQNSASNFRTYTHFYDVLRRFSVRQWFTGTFLIFGKNILFNLSWLNFFQQSKIYSFVFSNLLAHVISYPFMTVIRNLQTNSVLATSMMNHRQQDVLSCIKRINRMQGKSGFYRGFGPYAVVHSFLGVILVQKNMKSGYFEMLQ